MMVSDADLIAAGAKRVEPYWARTFRARVVPGADADCWLWRGFINQRGYGSFQAKRGERLLAHRCAIALAEGKWPTANVVCHRCDNPACVNPEHLFVGDQADNIRDMDAKGRRVRKGAAGNRNRNVKVRDEALPEMRAAREAGAKVKDIAARFGVSVSQASRILNGCRSVAP